MFIRVIRIPRKMKGYAHRQYNGTGWLGALSLNLFVAWRGRRLVQQHPIQPQLPDRLGELSSLPA